MAFTKDEISKLESLLESDDLRNYQLAIQLLKDSIPSNECFTIRYWIHQLFKFTGKKSPELLNPQQSYFELIPEKNNNKLYKISFQPGQFIPEKLNMDKICVFLINWVSLDDGEVNDSILKFIIRYSNDLNLKKKCCDLLVKEGCLDLGGMALVDFPEFVFDIHDINKLILWGNHLQELPNCWNKMTQLVTLNLAENAIEVLPPSFNQLQNLKHLFLHKNQLQIPSCVKTIESLMQLNKLTLNSEHCKNNSRNEAIDLELTINTRNPFYTPKKNELFIHFLNHNKQHYSDLSVEYFLDGMNSKNEKIRNKYVQALIHFTASGKKTSLNDKSIISMIGKIRFQTLNLIKDKLQLTKDLCISAETTHIVVGHYPKDLKDISTEKHTLISEEDVIRYCMTLENNPNA